MTDKELHILAKEGRHNGRRLNGKIQETHISYIILSGKFAFKIKKPVKFSFLDFSTLAKRKKFCERELTLNRRFSNIYLDVLPVRKHGSGSYIGNGKGEVIDYAVMMKKMMASRKMDVMLQQGKVTSERLQALVTEIAAFHRKAQVITSGFAESRMKEVFNDIQDVEKIVQEHLGDDDRHFIREAVRWNNRFIDAHSDHMKKRMRDGFVRDLHGDLHCGNIFLYKKPVLFDCIEFNDSFRQIDVLSEISFLCMDLEASDKWNLSRQFASSYTDALPCIYSKQDENLLVYYKCHRANVRAKIHALAAEQERGGDLYSGHIKSLCLYLALMRTYIRQLSHV